jgi:competence protein ComEC
MRSRIFTARMARAVHKTAERLGTVNPRARVQAWWTTEIEHGRHMLWVAPALAVGALLHLTLRADPPAIILYPMTAFVLFAAVALRARPVIGFAALAACSLCLGAAAADVAVRLAAAPMITDSLGTRTVRGHVLRVELRAERAPRILLRVAEIDGMEAADTPPRLFLIGRVLANLEVGVAVTVRARLEPVPRATHPGAYDPAFVAYFAGVGGYGFVTATPRSANLPPPPPVTRMLVAVEGWRTGITAQIVERLGPTTGPVAAALVTGQRTAIPEEVLQDFNASGLMHVLSISGLHMALVAGGLFWVFRALLAAIPPVALRWPVKKLAALLALAAATFYWIASGAEIATTRSYIMIIVVFAAILADRPAITMRNLALAALILVAIEPESILTASFQMSFGATAALVAAYERGLFPRFSHHDQALPIRSIARVVEVTVAVGLVSLVCELAILPFVLHHFHRVTWFGLVGNVLAHAIIDFLVMPAALLTLILVPFGWGDWAILVLGFGVERMHDVARFVASFPGAVTTVRGFGTLPMLLAAGGVAWACLWRSPIALLGVVPYAVGFLLWSTEQPPDLRVSATGEMVMVRGDTGRFVLDATRFDAFIARRWLEADADARPAEVAELSRGRFCDPSGCTIRLRDGTLVALPRQTAAFVEDCARADVIVSRITPPAACERPRLIIGRDDIARAHGLAIHWDATRPTVRDLARTCGTRPWCPDQDIPAPRRAFAPRVPLPAQ